VSPLLAALIFLAGTLASVAIGFWFRTLLPSHHVENEGRDTVKLATGFIATLCALVLGLLVSSAKNSFDTVSSGLIDEAARIIALDDLLADFGPDAAPLRRELHAAALSARAAIWPAHGSAALSLRNVETARVTERLTHAARRLTPQNPDQQLIKTQILQITADMARARWLVYLRAQQPLPLALLVALLFWLSVLHAGFGLLSARNLTVAISLAICALTVSATIFVILELDHPLTGVISTPRAPFDQAIAVLEFRQGSLAPPAPNPSGSPR